MSPSVSHRAKILNVLVCLVLIDKAESTVARTEAQKLQGSFNWGREPGGGGLLRDALNEFEARKIETTISRVLLQRTRQSQSRVQSSCALSIEEVQRFYDTSSGQWLISDDVLEELDNDVQAIIACASENDTLLFATNQTIKPTRTLILTQNLTLTSQSESRSNANGVPVSISKRVRLTCPDSGQLILSRSPSFTLRNLVIEDCNTTSSVIELDPDCIDERTTGSAKFHGLIIERNEVSVQGYIFSSSNARCLQLELNNVSIRHNHCVGSCALLSSNNTLNNVALVRNEGSSSNSQDSSIFSTYEGSETIALNVMSRNNEIRSFQLTNSTLRIADSHFRDNRRNISSVTRDTSIGGGVLFSNHSSVSISSTIFENNYAFKGGALFAWSSNISVNDCAFRENDAGEGNGGALYGHYNSALDIYSSVFSKNRGYFGAGVYSNYTRRVYMTNVSVWENNSSRSGGVRIDNGAARIISCEFIQNFAAQGAGALRATTVQLYMMNSTFSGNTASIGGACIFELNCIVRASNLLFENNTAQEHIGGIYFRLSGHMTITDSLLRNNHGHNDGGAIHSIGECEIVLRRTMFLNNTSGRWSGAVHINNGNFTGSDLTFRRNRATSNGGAIGFSQANTVSISRSRFEDNHAARGGAIQFYSTSSGYINQCTFVRNAGHEQSGGAIYSAISNVNISSSLFRANTAYSGGSLGFYDRCNSTILNSTFENNIVDGGGGAITMGPTCSLVLSNSSFSGNRGVIGGVLHLYTYSNASLSRLQFDQNYASFGGCIFFSDFGKVAISDSIFSNNAAARGGGAIELSSNCDLSMSSSTLVGNNGGSFGGGVQASNNSTLELNNVNFEKNEGTRGGAVYLSESCNANISSSSFTNNTASRLGGAILLYNNTTVSLTNSTFSGNIASFGGGLDIWNNSTAVLLFNSFARNIASTSGGAIYLESSNMFLLSSRLEFNRARYGGSLIALRASMEVINSTIIRSHARRYGGAISMEETNAKLERVRLESNVAMVRGGGIALINASSLLCYSCWIVSNRAFSGAGLYVYSNNSIPIVAQLQDSRFENNSAESYGGGIEFASPQNKSINCSGADMTCGHIILLNTSFKGNYANYSGAVVLATDPNRVLVDCEYKGRTKRNQDFLNRSQMNSLEVLDPGQLCSSWTRNRVSSNAYGDVVGTYGQEIVLTIDPVDNVRLVGSLAFGYVLENVQSGKQLPTINVTILDGYGAGPALTLPHSFEARISSPDEFFIGVHPTTIAAGFGNFSRVIGLVIPGTYTLQFAFDNEALETFNVTVMVRECQVGEEPTRDGLTCQKCDAFSYNFNTSDVGGCKQCPNDATCEGQYIVPREGAWHNSPCHDQVKDCLVENACKYQERQEALTDFTQNSTDCNMAETILETYRDHLCNEGYEGPLCGSCQTSFGLSLLFHCLKCPHKVLSFFIAVGVMLYLFATASFTIRGCLPFDISKAQYRSRRIPSNETRGASIPDPEINVEMVQMIVEGHVPREYFENIREATTSQITETSTQQENEYELTRWKLTELFKTTAVAGSVDYSWTNGVNGLFEASEYIGAVASSAISGPIDCLTSSASKITRAVFRMLFSIFVPGFVMCLFALLWGYLALRNGEDVSYFTKRTVLSIIAVTYISYLGLTRMAVRAFYCVDVYDSVNPFINSKTKFWAIDTSIECYERDHFSIIALAVVVLIVVTIAFPLISAIVLSKDKEVHMRRDSWMFETAGFLYRAFKRSCLFWESMVMLRKACLSIIVVFSYPLGGLSQGTLAIVVLLMSLYAHLMIKPYRHDFKILNHIESTSLLVSCLTFTLGLFFENERCSESVRSFLSVVIILANVSFFIFLLFVLLSSWISHLRVALHYQNVLLDQKAPWWTVLKTFITSRLQNPRN